MFSLDSRIVMTLVALLPVSACGGAEPSTEMPGMEMPPAGSGAPATSPADAMMEETTAHVRRMQAMPSDSIQAILPAHRQMVGNMLAQMNADMRSMNMATDAKWNALVDSIRADVVAMPDLAPAELASSMPAHLGRVQRTLESHAAMMRGMRM